MDSITTKIVEWGTLYGLRVIAAMVIVVLGRFAAVAGRGIVRKTLRKSRVDDTLVSFVSSLTYAVLLCIVVIAALGKLGFQTTSLVAILGAAGLAVALSLQGSLANFASGVLMIIFRPFKVGDFIEGAGVSGTVEAISIFTTELKSGDNKKIIVPNSKLTGDTITNFSAKEVRRIDMVVAAGYGDDLDKVKGVLRNILDQDERILKDPAPVVAVLALADSSVNFAVRPWVKTADYWPVNFALQETIKKRFDIEGISIPFPQQDVHLYNR